MSHRQQSTHYPLRAALFAIGFFTVFFLAVQTLFADNVHAADNAGEPLQIGYQKYGTLVLLKARGTLEKRLAPLGVDVRWTEFPAGPQLLEGLNVGSIHFGIVGEAPPIFAQAAGANLVYVANVPPAPTSEAIIVPKDSGIKTVADLKGKKIALNKGSNVHYLLVKLLQKHGLQYQDVNIAYLPPADARAAFERRSVDAWVIWDPYLASAQTQLGARVLADGKGVVSNHVFFLAARAFAERRDDIVAVIVDELAKLDQWAAKHPQEVTALLVGQTGLDTKTVALAVSRLSYGTKPVTATVLAEQQRIADTFVDLKLLPKQIAVKDAVVVKKRQPATTVSSNP